MVAHIVLFRPKPDIDPTDRQALLDALEAAATGIPSVRRVHVGTRVKHGPQYEKAMAEDYPYAAVIEFDDLAGLQAYLQHDRHQALGELFYRLLEAGMVYDYQMEAL
jgi:Stress responsive A/B Barrel Domain